MSDRIDSRVGTASLLLGSLWSIGIAVVAMAMWRAIPQFESLFRGFGAELPAVTRHVLAFRVPLLTVLTLSVFAQLGFLIALLATKTTARRRAHRFIAAANSLLLISVLVALYLPIFALGSVV